MKLKNTQASNYNLILISVISLMIALSSCAKQKEIELSSPDGNKTIKFSLAPDSKTKIADFAIWYGKKEVILPSDIQVNAQEIDFKGPFSIKSIEQTSVENEWTNSFGERSVVPNNYNEVKIQLESPLAKINLICRAYNEGIAFAYEIPVQNKLKKVSIDDELITYRFTDNHPVWSTPKREPGLLTAQGDYRKIPLNELEEGCERPLVVELADDIIIALAEAKLVDYARLSFNASQDGDFGIVSSLDGSIKAVKQDLITGAVENKRSENAKVVKTLPFQSPWRVVMMAENHGALLENNYLINNLNDASQIEDESWIKPGKVLRETTLTTKGGMAAIDFVASHNMQYVHFDAGWYGNEMDNNSDASTITLDPKRSKGPFDLEALTAYAKEKNVGVMVYVNRRALEKQLDELLPLFKKWGIAGIKFGFVRVGDQAATAWLHEAIKKAAEYQMIVDVHDEYRPTGFSRTYPNFLTQEGIKGDETTVTNQHTLITMFTRTLAGASDNTICYYNGRVEKMGSHASQLAKAVCIFSPLQFLYWYDRAPAAPVKEDALWGNTKLIGNEPELEFFNEVPTTWDETKVLIGEIGKVGVIARRKGDHWFIGGINGVDETQINLDFSFLNNGEKYEAKLYTDDESIKTRTRVKIEALKLSSNSTLTLDIKANNGFAMHIRKQN
ncbi:MAG: glycoside hydrolase family 97 protein [Saprospiraceae bacterium]